MADELTTVEALALADVLAQAIADVHWMAREASMTGLRRGGSFARMGLPDESPKPPRPECQERRCQWAGATHSPHPWDFSEGNEHG